MQMHTYRYTSKGIMEACGVDAQPLSQEPALHIKGVLCGIGLKGVPVRVGLWFGRREELHVGHISCDVASDGRLSGANVALDSDESHRHLCSSLSM